MPQELARQDKSIIQVVDERTILIDGGQGKSKQFTFNAVLGEKCQQMDVFQMCGVHELINSALEGYAATIFAYG